MGVVYYKYKSEKEVYSMPLAHVFISASELKQLILTNDPHGRGHGTSERVGTIKTRYLRTQILS
jgi:hypothetical protein